MFRRQYLHWSQASYGSRANSSRRARKGRPQITGRRFWVERLEERYLLAANVFSPWQSVWETVPNSGIFDPGQDSQQVQVAPADRPFEIGVSPPPPPRDLSEESSLAGGAALGDTPIPLEQTFFLHSLPGATKTIYLDFDGHQTRNTQWNIDFSVPNILTPAYSLDEDIASFSADERLVIQSVWERVSEDFRPFDINVTTEDPGIEALRNTGAGDVAWGQRAVIGGSTNDWYTPVDGMPVGGVSYGSFAWNSDTPNFTFATDYGDSAAGIASTVSHETGHALGLTHDGQFRFYVNIAEDPPVNVRVWIEYYPGHGTGATSWAPIMGGGGGAIEQWSKAEYFNATNDEDGEAPLQDDLDIIVNRNGVNENGVNYRVDDHGNTTATASPVVLDPITADLDTSLFTGEGIIEQNTDVDFFTFIVEGLGELVSLDIQPFHNGPNLDILAKLYDSSGDVIETADSVDVLGATFTDIELLPGTYYVSIEGTGRPIAFIDPDIHPGPIAGMGDPADPPLPPDTSDWGYSDYASLGYFSIAGTRKKNLVVGVNFDSVAGSNPQNWTKFSNGGAETVLTNLISELGIATPYDLTISTTGTGFQGQGSSIEVGQVPSHGLSLENLDGYISTASDSWSFVWSDLEPSAVYQVYVFGHSASAAQNRVTVIGGEWNGVLQALDFTQSTLPIELVVNDNSPSEESLSTLTLFIVADESGKITINVTPEAGAAAGLAGLAIAPTKVGSISGQKWNDKDGDGAKEQGENGLANWLIYLDVNNDGILNSTNDLEVTQLSPDTPQPLIDNAIKKSELFFEELGEIIDIDVNLDIAHEFTPDVDVYLISPSGTRVKLFSDIIPSSNLGFHGTILDQEAATAINTAAAPFTGRFRPEANISVGEQILYPTATTSLASLYGETSRGLWRLEVTDDANGDIGTLLGWSLTIEIAGVFLEPFTMTDASGNYSFTDLPPGVYHVREQIQEDQMLDGWKASWTPPPVTVRSNAQVVGIDFGNWIPVSLPGSISGQKWNDLDGDGIKQAGEPGLPGWNIYIDTDNDGELDTNSTSTIVSTNVPKSIVDFSNVQSQVAFNGLGLVAKVSVTLDITHSFAADLDVFLVSPSGTSVELFTGVGGQFNNFDDLTLDDGANRSIATIGVNDRPYSGTWRPEGHLSELIGEDAKGNWTLVIRDTTFADTGTLNSWSLTITIGEIFVETGPDGNYVFENLPPGTYRIREEQRPGWMQTFPTGNGSWQVAIGGGNVTGRNFGNRQLPRLTGDYNLDNTVNSADYVTWRFARGTDVEPFTGADGNGDGKVDEADFLEWKKNFGRTQPSGASLASSQAQPIGDETQPLSVSETASLNSSPVAAAVETSQTVDVVVSDATSATENAQTRTANVVDGRPIDSRVAGPRSDVSQAGPRGRSRLAGAGLARDTATGDNALIAWLSGNSRLGKSLAKTDFGIDSLGESSADSGDRDAVLDVLFDEIGAGGLLRP